MTKLENVSIEELQAVLDEVETKQETERLMIAILYKRGPSVPKIAEWFDLRPDTIYSWFDRFEKRPIKDAITDDKRSGRTRKLDEEALEQFESAVNQPPEESGYDQPAWSTRLAQEYIREVFSVEYSQRHVQRLLKEAGLRYLPPRSQPPTTEEDGGQQFWG